MSIEYVRVDVLRNVQGRIIHSYGGLPGVRDEGALESVLARPANPVHYTGINSIAELGASVAWAIIKSHPFNDGNKRAAFAALVIFLELNRFVIHCTEVEETAMVLRAAASELDEEQWTTWVKSVAQPRT